MVSLYVPFGGPSCTVHTTDSVTSKKSPNGYKSCPKMTSLEKLKILTSLQKLPENVGDLDKLIVAKGFESCPKSNKSPNLVTLSNSKNMGGLNLLSNRLSRTLIPVHLLKSKVFLYESQLKFIFRFKFHSKDRKLSSSFNF